MRVLRERAGFTLLEILVALTIVSLAVVSLIELSAHSMRLLKLATDHQRAVELADHMVRDTEVSEEVVDSGEEGPFAWERRVTVVPMPPELEPAQDATGEEAPRLFAVSVSVRWGRGQTVEVATLRGPSPPSVLEAEVPVEVSEEPAGPGGRPAGGAARTPSGSGSGPSAGRRSPTGPGGRGGSR
jgi:prepilin-type N-terminal cleavage/methylation domain-containing protein